MADEDRKIRIRSALVCEDLREDTDGKIIATGILSPSLSVTPPKPDAAGNLPPLKFHFLLVLDFLATGTMELNFRLKRAGARLGARARLDIRVDAAQKRVPFPVGPLTLKPRAGDTGFVLQQQREDRWLTIGRWEYEKPL